MSDFTWRATRGLLAILAAVLLLTAGAPAQEAANLGRLLEQTGLKTKVLGADAWSIPFDGNEGKSFEVFVTYWDETQRYALIFTTVVDRGDGYVFGAELMREALSLNNGHPTAKFVIDGKRGDLDCQTELDMSTVTPESLKRAINMVAVVAEQNRARLNGL